MATSKESSTSSHTIITSRLPPVVFSRHSGDPASISRSFLQRWPKSPFPNSIIAGTCDGLICLSNVEPDAADAYVWNPSTKSSEVSMNFVPRPGQNSFSFFGFGYDSVRKDYKVVKITQSPIQTVAEIRRLYGNGLQVLTLPAGSVPFLLTYAAPVTVDGCSHWIAVNLQNKNLEIVRFDMESESFVELPFCADMPNIEYNIRVHGVEPVAGQKRRAELNVNGKRFRLGVFKGQVCVFASNWSMVEIWSMKHCKPTTGVCWSREVEIEKTCRMNAVLGFTANDEMVICNSRDECFAYDLWKRRSVFPLGRYSSSRSDFDNQVVAYTQTNLFPVRPHHIASRL